MQLFEDVVGGGSPAEGVAVGVTSLWQNHIELQTKTKNENAR